ncbi:hypothetical protein SLA2020_136870 [Shorea laevis]
MDGEKWRQQRKLASSESSTKVLRDFSCFVVRRNSTKLVRAIAEPAVANRASRMQDMLMQCTLDLILKVGFGVDLNCMDGSSKEGIAFMKAFDEWNALIYWRFVDPFWTLKRFLNIGCEASLKRNFKITDGFVYNLIRTKRKLLPTQRDLIEECEGVYTLEIFGGEREESSVE